MGKKVKPQEGQEEFVEKSNQTPTKSKRLLRKKPWSET